MPWADALYGHDLKWWKHYDARIRETFKGDCVTGGCKWNGAELHPVPLYQNGGCGAISLAIHRGARRVILLAYDAQKTGGQVHHHGNHPKGLGNAGSMSTWPKLFRKLAMTLGKRAEIVNASRETALDMFPRIDLETAIADRDHAGSE